jgi:hypothetical protein
MGTVRRARNAIAIAILFIVIGVLYLALANPFGYRIEWAGGTFLVGLGAAMGLMAYVLIAGSPRD